jgi:hypothetical protein
LESRLSFFEAHVNSAAFETYLLGVDKSAVPLVIGLDQAVRQAHPKSTVEANSSKVLAASRAQTRTGKAPQPGPKG